MFNDNNFFSGGSAGFYPKIIEQSLRFNNDDSAYLQRTMSTPTAANKWTWSAWVKRGKVNTTQMLFTAGVDIDDYDYIQFNTSNQLVVYHGVNGSTSGYVLSTSLFRDPAAWYHIVVTFDGTLASSSRVTVYVNGVAQTLTVSTAFTTTYINTAIAHAIGVRYRPPSSYDSYFDGYMSEMHFVDGTAYTANTFGQFKAGVWVAKTPSVTYGTNGFYLDFANNGAPGTDVVNANNFTATGFQVNDQVIDSPTNNFATLNSVSTDFTTKSGYAYNGNLGFYTNAQQTYPSTTSTMAIPETGAYAEALVLAKVYAFFAGGFGVVSDDGTHTCILQCDGKLQQTGQADIATGISWGVGSYLGVGVNPSTGEFKCWRDGGSVATTTLPLGKKWLYWMPGYTKEGSTLYHHLRFNFGQDSSFGGYVAANGFTDINGIGDFRYSQANLYSALCTANLPEPAISPASNASPEDHMNTVIYTGNGTGQNISTGFQPDFTWIKSRSTADGHLLFDSVRGATKYLFSNATSAEGTAATSLTSFESDGFVLGSDAGSGYNGSGVGFVSWNWKAGGTPVSNTNGTITSSVSANVDAGFSVVSWTGTASASDTVGHGLNQAPEIAIYKQRNAVGDWSVLITVIDGSNDYLYLNLTAAKGDTAIGGVSATTINNWYATSSSMIAYCFHSVEGFSKFGKYTGNGSADGPFVYTGFRPSFLLIKRTDTTGDWVIFDTARDTYNAIDSALYTNLSVAEQNNPALDVLSNGFKHRAAFLNTNTSGGTYIYMAFAENPFKYSNAR